MMRKAVFATVLVAGASAVSTPVDKVVSLLTKLSEEVTKEGVAEAASYDKFACFCKEQASNKQYVIAKSDKKIKELSASIEELDGEIKVLDARVVDVKKEVGDETATQKTNREAREKDAKTYGEKAKSLAEAVEAVGSALETMRNSKGDVADQVSSLIQKLPGQHSGVALALIADAQAGMRDSKPGEATAYQYGSNEVVATLTTLKATFKKELKDLNSAEMTAVGDFEMTLGARSNTITALSKEQTEKETLSASKGEDKADADKMKDEETTARDADQGFLDDLTAKCEAKAGSWDKRSTTRASELTALGEAVELLKGMGNAYSVNSKLAGASLLQLTRGGHTTDEQKLQQLTGVLSKQAHSLKSASLAMLALQLQRAGGPDQFVKVRGIIKDLIKKLTDDAAAEATSKTLCDKNMKAAVEKRDKYAAALETAGAEIDSTTSEIVVLKAEISNLAKEVADLSKLLLEMGELRTTEKANNAKAIAAADGGKKAVDAAITLLNGFYKGSFIQADPAKSRSGKTVGDLSPDATFSDGQGKAGQGKGIVGILEVISSDFERTSTKVAADEKENAEDYETLKKDTDKDIVDKNKLKKNKEGDVDTKKSNLTGFEGDKKTAKDMQAEALEELEKLTASCVSNTESYAERAANRKQEIQALKDAMQILEDWK